MLRNKVLAITCVLALTAPLGAEEKPDIVEKNEAYEIEAHLPKLPDSEAILAAKIRADAMMYLDQFKADARIAQKEAEGQYPFRTYSLSTNWSVELEHPRFISLINTSWMYTGGAHGNTLYDSLAFDRKYRRIIKLGSLFDGEEAEAKARKAMRAYVIKDILRQKAERAGKPPEGFEDEWVSNGVEGKFRVFTIEPSDQKGKIAGLRMWYGPYAVGSFAAGPFDAFVPAKVFKRHLSVELKPLFGGKSARKEP